MKARNRKESVSLKNVLKDGKAEGCRAWRDRGRTGQVLIKRNCGMMEELMHGGMTRRKKEEDADEESIL